MTEADDFELVLDGAATGVANALATVLVHDPVVAFAAFRLPHPLDSSATVVVRADGAERECCLRACDEIRSALRRMIDQLPLPEHALPPMEPSSVLRGVTLRSCTPGRT